MYGKELAKACEMIADYMDMVYDYSISQITCNENDIAFYIQEYRTTPYILHIINGRIYNDIMDDCIDTMKSAFEDDANTMQWISNFENKWYKEN